MEDDAEAHYFREATGFSDAPHQPLTGWLYLVAARMVQKGDVSKLVKMRTGIDPKTLTKGLPKTVSKQSLMVKRLNEDLERRCKLENPQFVLNTKRTVTLLNKASAEHPDLNPCVSFLGELGALAGYEFGVLCHGVDSLSKTMLYGGLTREQLGQGLPELAALCGFIKSKGSIPPATSLDPGLDALLAALDRMIMHDAWGDQGLPFSLFGLVIGNVGLPARAAPMRRLLDVFFGIAVLVERKPLPSRLPSVEELERKLLDPRLRRPPAFSSGAV